VILRKRRSVDLPRDDDDDVPELEESSAAEVMRESPVLGLRRSLGMTLRKRARRLAGRGHGRRSNRK
jgi:hypothetical protein